MVGLRHDEAQQDLDDLVVVLGKCAELLPILQRLMAEQPGYGPRASTIGRHPPESKEPWAVEPANAFWTMWFGSRIVADTMRISIGLGAASWRNGENGLEVITACAPIVEARVLREALRTARRWRELALQIRDIDVEDRWTPVPRASGTRPAVCPYCRTPSLRLNRARGEVKCLFPGCVDAAGNPTRARMEYAPDQVQGMLVFSDDTTVTFSNAA